MIRLLPLLALLACAGDSPPVQAPGPDRVLQGPFTGLRVDSSADLTGDGAPDVLISAPGLDGDGGVYVFDAASTGQYSLDSAAGSVSASVPLDVGEGLAGCSDLNGDGQPDLLIGSPDSNNSQGGVWVVHGPVSGNSQTASHWEIRGTIPNGRGGYSVRCGGDFDGDGLADLVFSSPDGDGFGLGERTGQIFFHRGQEQGFTPGFGFCSDHGWPLRCNSGAVDDQRGKSVKSKRNYTVSF